MTLGALIDLGLPVSDLEELLNLLGLAELQLTAPRVTKDHLTGVHLQVDFRFRSPQPTRSYREIHALISGAPLSAGVQERSLAMFRLLGEVEARIHGQPLEEVHFHELGALDTILDIVGVAYGVEKLGITRVFCSSLPMGYGMIAAGHGRLPNPAPATLELLKGLPVYGTDLPGELVTPTGAVILKGLEASFEPCPPLLLDTGGLRRRHPGAAGAPQSAAHLSGRALNSGPGPPGAGAGAGDPHRRHEPGAL